MPSLPHHRQWKRFLRPLFWWLLLVLALFAIRTHERLMQQTRIEFTVTLENQPVFDATARLDGKPIVSGKKISLGQHTFTVSQPKADTFATNFFAWYGRHDFGRINLKRSMGTLSIYADPPASKITVTGPEFSATLYGCTSTNLTVPTDTYAIHAKYAHWSGLQNETVFSGMMAMCAFRPRLGTLRLTCNKDDTSYRLQFFNGQTVDTGNMPATVKGLPASSYRLTATYHNRQLQQSVLVEAGKTNDVSLQFVLGDAKIESTPSGAEVHSAGGFYLGQTPLSLIDQKPQTARFDLTLNGYEPATVTVDIEADKTNVCRTNLTNIEYASAMRNARGYLAASNYNAVVQAAGNALSAVPDDADALALQRKATGYLDAERERLAQLKRPREVFDEVCAKDASSRLFAEHDMKTSKPVKEAHAAIVKALKASPHGFQIMYDGSPKPKVYQIMAKQEFSLGILGGSERVVILVVGQAKPGETEILFKVMEFQIQHTIVGDHLTFHDVKQLIPVTSEKAKTSALLGLQFSEGVKKVTDRINEALE